MDIVEQMRGFECDHEPDGWPAIQMKQISALCDEIERLQGEIDEANAQEPAGYTGSGSIDAVNVGVEGHLFGSSAPSHPIALYAIPIPAQQSTAVAVPASLDLSFIEDCLIAYSDGLYFDGYEGLRKKIDQQINLIKSPSPRITEQDALPDGYKEEWKRNVMLMWSCVRKHDSSIPSDVLDYMREQLLNKLNGDHNGK